MRIVILGGTGFIGQHLAKFCRLSADVVVVSRHQSSDEDCLTGVEYLQGDCASSEFLRQTICPEDYVVFLAYNSVPKTSFDDPLRDIQENLPLAISLLSVLREVPISRLIYVSSGGTVYGPAEAGIPIVEDHPTDPISPYGITKLAVEKYCRMYARLFGIPVVIARPSNPFGPGQTPHRGQGFIATAIAKLLRGDEMSVFGESGTVRDYLYIDDLCTAIKVLLTSNIEPGSIYNIGSHIGRNNVEVIEAIIVAAEIPLSNIKINFLPSREFDVPYNVLNSTKMRALGWHLSITFEQSLAKTIPWVASYLRTP